MSRVASEAGIDFDQVWKKFRRGERHDSLRELLPALGRRLTRGKQRSDELREFDFWALRNVSFEVRPGDTLGIIGRNGAGKSTILKTLTRIMRPTRGRCEVRGRVGALIEISAGFHQDLTGRENVQLQGVIMGMPKKLIASRFDEIVSFSGVEAFIDTPVKRYSSGMNARLGFAIAAHLDPDVLIIDEVLAVGDFQFQARAYNRVSQLARSGLPVVVVTHQLDRVAQLCNKAILMEAGAIARAGTTEECIRTYLTSKDEPSQSNAAVRVTNIESTAPSVRSGGFVSVHLSGMVEGARAKGTELVGFELRNLQTGAVLAGISNEGTDSPLPTDGNFVMDVQVQMNVPPGLYGIDAVVWDRDLRTTLGSGPGVHVQVLDGPFFWGQVQLNAEVRVSDARLPARADPRASVLPS